MRRLTANKCLGRAPTMPVPKMLTGRVRKEAGLAQFTARQIRHTALTMRVRHGVDLHTIKHLSAHAPVTATEADLSLAGEDLTSTDRLPI